MKLRSVLKAAKTIEETMGTGPKTIKIHQNPSKNHAKPMKSHQKSMNNTMKTMEAWRAADFFQTLYLDGLEATGFAGAMVIEAQAIPLAKEIRMTLDAFRCTF